MKCLVDPPTSSKFWINHCHFIIQNFYNPTEFLAQLIWPMESLLDFIKESGDIRVFLQFNKYPYVVWYYMSQLNYVTRKNLGFGYHLFECLLLSAHVWIYKIGTQKAAKLMPLFCTSWNTLYQMTSPHSIILLLNICHDWGSPALSTWAQA